MEITFPTWLCRTASYLRSNKETYKREQSKTKLALILFCRAEASSSFNAKIAKGESRDKWKSHFRLDYAEPHPISIVTDTYKQEQSKTKLALILFCQAEVSSSFNSKIAKRECKDKRKSYFRLDYAEPYLYKYSESQR